MVAAHAESAHIPSRSNAGPAAVRLWVMVHISHHITESAIDRMRIHHFLVGIAARCSLLDVKLVKECSVRVHVLL